MSEQQDVLNLSVRDFAAATAAKTPTPGGGSVAGVVGALGAALGEMALNFTRGKKKFAQHAADHEHAARRLERARQAFLGLVGEDIAAYRYYQEVSRREDGPGKQQEMEAATAAAVNVPRELTKFALALLEDLRFLADKCSPGLVSDLLAAGALAVAAARLSDFNVRINVPYVADPQAGAELRQVSGDDVRRAQALFEDLERALRELLP